MEEEEEGEEEEEEEEEEDMIRMRQEAKIVTISCDSKPDA